MKWVKCDRNVLYGYYYYKKDVFMMNLIKYTFDHSLMSRLKKNNIGKYSTTLD